MSSVSNVQKKAVALAISLNPTIVTVARTEYAEVDGARQVKSSTAGPYTICLFSRFSRAGSGQSNDVAGLKDTVTWTALADSNSTFKWGPNVEDTFEVAQFGKFKINYATPVEAEGVIAGYLLQLEAVK